MKFKSAYLSLILFSLLSTANCTTSSEDLIVCKKACNALLLRLFYFIYDPNRNQGGYNALSPFWTTCQYRCYRCHLASAYVNMNDLEKTFQNEELPEQRKIGRLVNHRNEIMNSIKNTCYGNWEKAIEINDHTSTF